METIELISYLLFFALSVIFTSFTVEKKSPVYSFMAMVTWLVLALMHAGVSYGTMFFDLQWFYYGMGMIFLVMGWGLSISLLLKIHNQRKADMESEWEII